MALVKAVTTLFAVSAAILPLFFTSSACVNGRPPNRPIDLCTSACADQASRQCSVDECRRGCEFITDRIVEKEEKVVIACVATHDRRCSDRVWANCAVRVGVHLDGGPPAPPPPDDEWD